MLPAGGSFAADYGGSEAVLSSCITDVWLVRQPSRSIHGEFFVKPVVRVFFMELSQKMHVTLLSICGPVKADLSFLKRKVFSLSIINSLHFSTGYAHARWNISRLFQCTLREYLTKTDPGAPFRVLRCPATSPACLLTMEESAQVRPNSVRVCSRWRRHHRPYGPRKQIVIEKVREGRCGVFGVVRTGWWERMWSGSRKFLGLADKVAWEAWERVLRLNVRMGGCVVADRVAARAVAAIFLPVVDWIGEVAAPDGAWT